MQVLTESDKRVRLELNTIADLVKNIVQLFNDNIEAAIVSTEENDRYFASFLDEKEKGQQNINEIYQAMTENNIEITNFIPSTVPSEDEIRKRNTQDKENFIQTKIDQPDPDTIERAYREKEKG